MVRTRESEPGERPDERRSARAADRGLGLFILVALGTAVLILIAAGVWFWRG